MAPLVKELLGEDKEKYSIEKEEYSKQELVKKTLEQVLSPVFALPNIIYL